VPRAKRIGSSLHLIELLLRVFFLDDIRFSKNWNHAQTTRHDHLSVREFPEKKELARRRRSSAAKKSKQTLMAIHPFIRSCLIHGTGANPCNDTHPRKPIPFESFSVNSS
jgi:hypothetical protein